jgi:hypothetical protein
MFALVESGSITQMPKGNKGITIGDNKYPAAIYTLWTEAERNAIGIYTVEIDNTNKKDEEWYYNTNITYAFSGGKVKGTYGTAIAKAIADVNEVCTMDSGWKTWRASVRTKCNSMQTQIDNASDVDALAALFTYTYDSETKVTSRPLGEFPIKE